VQAKTSKDSDRANALLDRQHAERTVLQEHERQIAKNGLDRVRAQAEELFHPFGTHLSGLVSFFVEMAVQLQLDVFGGLIVRDCSEHYQNLAHPHSFYLGMGNTPAFQAGFGKILGLGMLKSAPAVVDALAADPAKQAAYVQMVQTVWAPKHMALADIVRTKRHLAENSEQLWQMMEAMVKFGTGDKGSVGVGGAMTNSAHRLLGEFETHASCWQPVLANWVRVQPCGRSVLPGYNTK
jgi:hypothetical protein